MSNNIGLNFTAIEGVDNLQVQIAKAIKDPKTPLREVRALQALLKTAINSAVSVEVVGGVGLKSGGLTATQAVKIQDNSGLVHRKAKVDGETVYLSTGCTVESRLDFADVGEAAEVGRMAKLAFSKFQGYQTSATVPVDNADKAQGKTQSKALVQ